MQPICYLYLSVYDFQAESNQNWLRLTFVGYQRFMAKVASCKLKIFNKVCRLRNITELSLSYISKIKMWIITN